MNRRRALARSVEEKMLFGYRGRTKKEPSRAARLEQLDKVIRACQKCDLHKRRTHAVPGAGVLDPRVMIVGEGPGASEDLRGLPFVGKAGQYLDKWLAAIHLSREKDVYITNVVKCRPPGNRTPSPTEVNLCAHYLTAQIQLIRPRFILALGLPASNFLRGEVSKMAAIRGRITSYQGVPLMATYHPSAVLRNPDFLRPKVWEDLQKLEKALR